MIIIDSRHWYIWWFGMNGWRCEGWLIDGLMLFCFPLRHFRISFTSHTPHCMSASSFAGIVYISCESDSLLRRFSIYVFLLHLNFRAVIPADEVKKIQEYNCWVLTTCWWVQGVCVRELRVRSLSLPRRTTTTTLQLLHLEHFGFFFLTQA